MHIEWASTRDAAEITDHDFEDEWGTKVDPDKLGFFVGSRESGVVLEGTRDEIVTWLRDALIMVESQ